MICIAGKPIAIPRATFRIMLSLLGSAKMPQRKASNTRTKESDQKTVAADTPIARGSGSLRSRRRCVVIAAPMIDPTVCRQQQQPTYIVTAGLRRRSGSCLAMWTGSDAMLHLFGGGGQNHHAERDVYGDRRHHAPRDDLRYLNPPVHNAAMTAMTAMTAIPSREPATTPAVTLPSCFI